MSVKGGMGMFSWRQMAVIGSRQKSWIASCGKTKKRSNALNMKLMG